MRTIQIEAIVFSKKGNEYVYLLLKRIPEKGGFWQPITGGKEEVDKSILDAVYREIKEEANITREKVLRVIENVHYFEFKPSTLDGKMAPIMKEYVFGIEVKSNEKIEIDKNIYPEHEEIKWVNFEDAIKLLKWDNNKDAFRKLNQMLATN